MKRSLKRKRRWEQMQKEQKKHGRVKLVLAVITYCFALLFAGLTYYYGKDYYHKKKHCTAVTYGNNIYYQVNEDGSRNTPKKNRAIFHVPADGEHGSWDIFADGTYYAKKESVRVYFDPDETSVYYLEGELREMPVVIAFFAAAAVGMHSVGVLIIRNFLKTRKLPDPGM